MEITLERQIYKAIRGQCISDSSAERAAVLAAEIAEKKFTSDKTQSTQSHKWISGYVAGMGNIKACTNCNSIFIGRVHS